MGGAKPVEHVGVLCRQVDGKIAHQPVLIVGRVAALSQHAGDQPVGVAQGAVGSIHEGVLDLRPPRPIELARLRRQGTHLVAGAPLLAGLESDSASRMLPVSVTARSYSGPKRLRRPARRAWEDIPTQTPTAASTRTSSRMTRYLMSQSYPIPARSRRVAAGLEAGHVRRPATSQPDRRR